MPGNHLKSIEVVRARVSAPGVGMKAGLDYFVAEASMISTLNP